MKRKAEVCEEAPSRNTRSRKTGIFHEYTPPSRSKTWINGTDVRNYMIRDPLVDWLKLYKRTGHSSKNQFFEFITQRGHEFEREIIDHINSTRIPVVHVSDRITDEACQKTIQLMREGVPVIHSAPFRNTTRKTRGVIDLLVRSDYLSRLVDENPEIPNMSAPNLNGRYHYVVIDVKFSTLPLRADGKHLLNSGSYPAYKAQLWIYTDAIGTIQGYTPRYAFILGRRWNYLSKGEKFSGLKCLDKLGIIDYGGVDLEYISRTIKAMNWLRDVRRYGRTWTTDPPSREELYPNMCVDSGEWNTEKKIIANKIGDITQIWYCGVKQRQKAIEQGILSWRDGRCNSTTLGMSGSRGSIIDKIIAVNRQNSDKIRPKVIRSELYGWQIPDNEIFVDFETFCDVFSSLDCLPEQPRTDGIFMIGVWHKDFAGTWQYRSFIVKDTTPREEYRIMNDFMDFYREKKQPKIWYWHAEQYIWTKAENRQMDLAWEENDIDRSDNIVDNWQIQEWADLCVLFRTEPIVIKDCFKFGLKEVASAMHKHGLITTKLESVCQSGLDVAAKAWQTYQTVANPDLSPEIQDIAKYNRFDVKVLQEIVSYLRLHHTSTY